MSLEKVAKGLRKASKTHAEQAGMVEDHIEEMEESSPAKIKRTKNIWALQSCS